MFGSNFGALVRVACFHSNDLFIKFLPVPVLLRGCRRDGGLPPLKYIRVFLGNNFFQN